MVGIKSRPFFPWRVLPKKFVVVLAVFLAVLSHVIVKAEQGGSFDPYLSHELQSKLQLSQRLAGEMDKFRNQLLHQATVVNRRALIKALQKKNFANAYASFSFMTSIVLQIYFSVYGKTSATFGDVIQVGGMAAEEASYDAEGFLSVKNIDTSCLNGLSELEHRYDLAGKFLEIESGFVYGEGGRGSPTLEGKKEELLLDIMDFNREFQDTASCVISSDINAEKERLLGLLGLYTAAANKRLRLFL